MNRSTPAGETEPSTNIANSSPSDASCGVGGTDGGLQPECQRDQEFVAHAVAVHVVDDLEVVHVEEEHADHRAVALSLHQCVADPVLEEHAVGQAGERVMERLVGEFAFQLSLLGHILQSEHHPTDGRLLTQVAPPHLDLDGRPVGADHAPVLAPALVLAAPHPAERLDHRAAVLWRHRIDDLGALQVRNAEHLADGGAGVTDPVVVVEDQDDLGGVLHQRAEVRLAVAPVDLLGKDDPRHDKSCLRGESLEKDTQDNTDDAGHSNHDENQRLFRKCVVERGQRDDARTDGGHRGLASQSRVHPNSPPARATRRADRAGRTAPGDGGEARGSGPTKENSPVSGLSPGRL
nr:hypothetical protein [Streptomyces sp. AC555_RSS877]